MISITILHDYDYDYDYHCEVDHDILNMIKVFSHKKLVTEE